MGFLNEIKKAGNIFVDPLDLGGAAQGLYDDVRGKNQQRAIEDAAELSNDASKRREALLRPFLDEGMKFLDPVANASSAQGFDQRFSDLSSTNLFGSLLEEGNKNLSDGLGAAGLTRSGYAMKKYSELPISILQGLESQLFGRQQGMLNMGQNSAAGVGNIIGQNAQTQGQSFIDSATAGALGTQNLLNLGSSVGGMFFSDDRLKTNIIKKGERRGQNIYSWEWKEKVPEAIKSQSTIGFLASEVPQEFKGQLQGFEYIKYPEYIEYLETK